jgi:hypothetical protein
VNDDFKALFELLEAPAREVSGREAPPAVSLEVRKRLAKLAAGECNPEERGELLVLLEEQPELIAELAREVKKLRNAAK